MGWPFLGCVRKQGYYESSVSISDKSTEPVLIQGELGRLDEIYFLEGVTLEIKGSKGTLRLDLSKEELDTLLARAQK